MKHRTNTRTTIVVGTTAALLALAGLAAARPPANSGGVVGMERVTLTGIVRDFQGNGERVTHPDFDSLAGGGSGVYMGNVAATLDADAKPVFAGQGRKVRQNWRDSGNRSINPSAFSAALGDRAGSYTGPIDTTGIHSAQSFSQWFRDVPGINLSMPISIDLVRNQSGRFVFDDTMDPLYGNRQGFFPINRDLFGNTPNESSNYHFSYELQTNFQYRPGGGGMFTFASTDDVWVYINGRLVIDLGGTHNVELQCVHLDRLSFINDGENTMRIFLAERNRTQSNFRMEVSGVFLRPAQLPNSANLYD